MINNFIIWYKKIIGKECPGNQHYGHNIILKNYAEAKGSYIIPGNLQHGWHPDCGFYEGLSKNNEKHQAKKYFVWNKRNLEKSLEYGYKNVLAIGAPFLYLPPIIYQKAIYGSKSLLLFAPHSSEFEPFVNVFKIYKSYLKEIEKLLFLFKPVTVCLYWIQHKDKRIIKLFKDKGINVVTLGHRDKNPNFLIDFQTLVNKYTYISTNRFSTTATFYGLYMRKKVFIFGKFDASQINSFGLNLQRHQRQDYFSSLYPQLIWKNFNDKSHYLLGEKELGLEFKKSPKELREIFEWILIKK